MKDENQNWHEHSGKLIDSINNYDIIECSSCKIKHIIPIPSHKKLENFYKNKFYEQEKPDYFKKHKEDLEWWNLVYRERYERFSEYLSTSQRRILDVGCGPGYFLKLGNELRWKTFGIEPSSKAVEYAKGLGIKVLKGELTEENAKNIGKFDVIHTQGVMEHLPNPKKIIEICYDLIERGGLFCTIVANDYNPLQKILREDLEYPPWWLIPPEHINYFTIHSLKKLVISIGFEEVYVTTTFPMEFFLLMGDNYVGNDSLGRACHYKRKNFEFAFKKAGITELKQKIYHEFANLDIGRDIVAIFKKLD